MCVHMRVCAHVCMFTQKFTMRNGLMQLWGLNSPRLPSASWRPRKARGVIQPECEGLRTSKSVVQIPVQGQEKMR